VPAALKVMIPSMTQIRLLLARVGPVIAPVIVVTCEGVIVVPE